MSQLEHFPEDTAFREEARGWLTENAAAFRSPVDHTPAELVAASRVWVRAKAEAGFALIEEPPEFGGRNGTARMAEIFAEEEAAYFTPQVTGVNMGLGMALKVIKKHGTPEQYRRFARATAFGEMTWCQLFSEPAAGSDLGGLRTKAVREGEGWLVNGQKVWSSWAAFADYGLLLARTDPTVVKHKGLTFFLLDMKTPGVEVRPIRQINGNSDFNETFLTDVAVPDADRLGAPGEGWACALTVLTHERAGHSGAWREIAGGAMGLIRKARATPRGAGTALDSAAVRSKLAQWWAEEQGLKHHQTLIDEKIARGEPALTVPVTKLVFASKLQQTQGFLMDIDEYEGAVVTPETAERERVHYYYLWGAGLRIAGGADEIMRNQLAERALGLPAEPRLDKVPFNELPGVKG